MTDVIEPINETKENGKISKDDDENYLYGKGDVKSEQTVINGVEEIKKAGEDDDDGEFEESDDDDDDDNIQVHIGEVNTSANNQYGTPVAWKKDAAASGGAVKGASLPTQGQKKIDVNAVGLINGQPIYEYDIDNEQDEKPWRKPGADISDYFNYGFTEETWKQYCEKQRRMRLESNRGPYSVAPSAAATAASTAQVEIEVLPDGRTRVKAGPPPDRKVEGSIHVLGSDADARRKQKEEELLALALGSSRVVPPQPFAARPMFTTLPNGAVVYNPMGPQIPNSSTDSSSNSGGPPINSSSSQPQPIQSIGPNIVNSGFPPPGLQYIHGGGLPGMPGVPGPPIFPAPGNMGLDFPPNDGFAHPGGIHTSGYNRHSDSEFDSDGERRHRHRESSRHKRHRDRSDRDRTRDRDRDRDRSKRDKDKSSSSSSRRKRDESKSSSSDRKRRSSRSGRGDDDESSEKKSRSSRKSKHADNNTDDVKKEPQTDETSEKVEVKKEPEETAET